MATDHIGQLIKLALDEDIGGTDITSEAIVDPKLAATARIVAKERLVVAGLDIAQRVFRTVDPQIVWDAKHEDGESCEAKKVLAIVKGNARSLLAAERTAVNFLQHLSGIATSTSMLAKTVADTKVKILDTRKTTPGMRALEKHAVLMGDGVNHRMGLYDRYLIKNNHIAIAGSVCEAINRVKKNRKQGILLEVEVATLDDLRDALECGVDIVMLDNMPVSDVREAVKITKGRAKLEVSGNITLDNAAHYAATGIDFISVGAITHSAPAADIHMVMEI
jgi:nicotinate-nucleotide pyrophosphorylase (carboxylating)